MLFQATTIYLLYVEKIGKENYAKRHYVEWKQPLRWKLVWLAKKHFYKRKWAQEYFKNFVLSVKSSIVPLHLHTLSSSSFLMEHRSSTSARHLTLLWAVRFTSCHVSCLFSNTAILVRLQVCWGLPLFRFPCGFHSIALLAMHPSGLHFVHC